MEVSKIKELINNEGMKSDMKNMKALKFLRETKQHYKARICRRRQKKLKRRRKKGREEGKTGTG